MTNTLPQLEKTLKVKFKNPLLLQNALVHRSYINENQTIRQSNERLEFLGDSVLSLIVSTQLYSQFPDYPEGKLTSIRSLLVKAKTLAQIASDLGLGEFLLMSKGEERSGGRQNLSLLADTLEAVIGAIYLDQGLTAATSFLRRILFPLIPLVEQDKDLLDYKSSLQEIVQEKHRLSPTYKVLSETGPDHDKTFTVGVFIAHDLIASALGKSKHTAEQQAAKLALEKSTQIG